VVGTGLGILVGGDILTTIDHRRSVTLMISVEVKNFKPGQRARLTILQ